MTTETTQQSTDLVRVATSLKEGKLATLASVLDEVAPRPVPQKPPATLPVPREPTAEQLQAIKTLPEVYGVVVPDVHRELEDGELVAIAEEREVLKTVEKMVKERVNDITITVHNDLDEREPEEAEFFTKKGNKVLPTEVDIPDSDQKFVRQVSEKKPVLSEAKLRELADDPDYEGFTHKDYLSMTSQVRVVDEAKIMIALRSNSDLLKAIGDASSTPDPNAAIYVRKR